MSTTACRPNAGLTPRLPRLEVLQRGALGPFGRDGSGLRRNQQLCDLCAAFGNTVSGTNDRNVDHFAIFLRGNLQIMKIMRVKRVAVEQEIG